MSILFVSPYACSSQMYINIPPYIYRDRYIYIYTRNYLPISMYRETIYLSLYRTRLTATWKGLSARYIQNQNKTDISRDELNRAKIVWGG